VNWGVIPEVFFDIIGRIVPGTLLILAAIAVSLGPGSAIARVADTPRSLGVATLLILAILAYFTAIVTKQIWDWVYGLLLVIRRGKQSAEQTLVDDVFVTIYEARSELPAEGYRLLKIQAEKNLCEVMITGLILLLPLNLWLLWLGPDPDNGRLVLAAAMLLSILACWSWRRTLDAIYQECLRELRDILGRKHDV
jgi:hypothetical protein